MPSDFRILGPVQVLVDRQVVPIRAPKIRVLLGALLVHPNKAVGIEDLADRLWESGPRRKVKSTMQTYVWRLRGLLGDADGERVVTTADGYQIQVEPDELDLIRFRTLSDRARAADDPFVQAGLLERALAQWQGSPLEDIASDLMRTVDAPPLEQERLAALEHRFAVELRLGRHGDVIGELRAITAEQPLRERFHAQLMLALYRSGRQADVFTVYRKLASDLSEHLGVDPTPELRRLHQRILTNDPTVAAPAERAVVRVQEVRAPRGLPMDIGDFVGRDKVKGQIAAQLTESGSGVPLVVVSGQPGVGKTALAVHVAHELRDRYPDGQLYADLRGHASAAPLAPVELLPRFLISLGVPPQRVPKEMDDLVALYRTLLADRKVLVLLDNVGTPQQVRPLLPNASGCAVIVTSRNELRGLTALQGARPIALDVLPVEQARVLLAGIIGPARVESEPSESRELAELCGYLPLALRIAAANLASMPDRSLGDYVTDLHEGNRLAALAIDGDDEATVRAAFALSHQALDERAARLFRLLGLIPGPDFTADAVAALTAMSTEDSQKLLDLLATANLVNRKTGTRYQLHDLLRLYAAEQCHQDDDRTAIRAAKERLFHFYLHWLDACEESLSPVWTRLPRPASTIDLPPVVLGGTAAATAWLDEDCLNLFAAVEDAVADGFPQLAWPMATALRAYLRITGRYRVEGMAVCGTALRSAVDHGNPEAEAALHITMAIVHNRHSDVDRAVFHDLEAVRAHRTSGSPSGLAVALIALGNSLHAAGDLNQAATHILEGHRLAEEHGDRMLRRFGWLNLSLVELLRGNLVSSEEASRQNLSLLDGNEREPLSEGEARTILGKALQWQGRTDEAIEELTRALGLYQLGTVPQYEAIALNHLVSAYREKGDLATAMRHARSALTRAGECGAQHIAVDALNGMASVHFASGDHDLALADYDRVERICDTVSNLRAELTALLGHAEINLAAGNVAAAAAQAGKALSLSDPSGYRMYAGRSKTVLAKSRLITGDLDEAVALATAAAAIANELGARIDESRALRLLDSISGTPTLPEMAP